MAVTNHPLGSAAAAETLAAGGNAADAAIAGLFALSVAEPMMVGILGGGMFHLRLPDGRHVVIDNQSRAPLSTGPTTYTPDPNAAPGTMDALERANALGPRAVASPGNLKGWCEVLARFGTLPLADVMEPAIRLAARGFRATPFLSDCAADCAADLARDAPIARLFLPDGQPVRPGARVVMGEYAETLRLIAREGPGTLYGGALGALYVEHIGRAGGYLAARDLTEYRTVEREAVRGTYRGHEILGPPPPSSGPLHIVQMLNILEAFDLRALGFRAPETNHLIAEALKIAFADRAAATADPDFVAVPVARLLSKDYAAQRRAEIGERARDFAAGVAPAESAHTTHLTVADGDGMVVAATQTINSLFGARFLVPGTGMIPNNYMYLFTPHPGRANSVAPGKRVTSSMSPVIVLREGRPAYALGLPGGLRIFASVMQALINLIDHGMTLAEAVEAPRLWTQGFAVEMERTFGEEAVRAMEARGHRVSVVPNVAGGMCAIAFEPDGLMTGAACWRADGVPIGLGGGLARPGVRFRPEALAG
ncbi:MAG: gamma-glutamyltransferase [Acetobacteraceae bacterium]|nr:gamma-glutamyltransferase [Acetobacteraceae bacterium]